MKFNAVISSLLLFAAGVDAQAMRGDCKDLQIKNKSDCQSKCKSLAKGNNRSWSIKVKYDADGNLTQCDCTFSTGNSPEKNGLPTEGILTCTTERTPEPPVNDNGRCPESIKTWDDCRNHCKSLSGNWGASYVGRSPAQLTKCTCNYGPNRQNSYTSTRKASVESYLRSN
jgi:hypothetical protein